MNYIEKKALAFKIPKGTKRDEFYRLLGRQNLHEHRDMGNDDHVLNIIDESKVVDRENCLGEIHIVSASSGYVIKTLTYELKYAKTDTENNEMVILKSEDLILNRNEEVALDRYVSSFCSKIKRELNYSLTYSINVIKASVYNMETQKQEEYNVVDMNDEAVTLSEENVMMQQNSNDNIVEETVETTTVKNNKKSSFNLNIDDFYNANLANILNGVSEKNIYITAYYKDMEFGVCAEASGVELAKVTVSNDVTLSEADQTRSMAISICIAQTLAMICKLQDKDCNIKYFYYQDRDTQNAIPADFIDISSKVNEMQASN